MVWPYHRDHSIHIERECSHWPACRATWKKRVRLSAAVRPINYKLLIYFMAFEVCLLLLCQNILVKGLNDFKSNLLLVKKLKLNKTNIRFPYFKIIFLNSYFNTQIMLVLFLYLKIESYFSTPLFYICFAVGPNISWLGSGNFSCDFFNILSLCVYYDLYVIDSHTRSATSLRNYVSETEF